MVYVVGFFGFLSGFALGQILLMRWLKDRSREELMSDSNLRWSYGVFNWLVAGLCSWLAVVMYNHYQSDSLLF
jgi:hypothetical protein